jgi:hypothetical protein
VRSKQIAGWGLVALLSGAIVALAGCGGSSKTITSTAAGEGKTTPGVYVGRVAGSDAFIALATNGSRVGGGYICDGHKLSVWLRSANLHDGQAALISRQGTVVGQASFSGHSATGSVAVAGATRAYTTQIATGQGGLYRTASGISGKPSFRETGWIVLPNGSVKGTTRFTNPVGTLETMPASGSPKGKTTSNFTNPITGI